MRCPAGVWFPCADAGRLPAGSLQSLAATGRPGRRRAMRPLIPSGTTDAPTALPTTTARFLRALPLVGAAGLAAYGLLSTAGGLGAVLLGVVVVLAVGMAVWAKRTGADARLALAATATGGLLALPALLVAFFSFS